MKFIALLIPLTLLLTLSCKNKQGATKTDTKSFFNQDTTIASTGIRYDMRDAPSDKVTIEKAIIREGILILSVQYGGGCKVHEFGINAQSAIMKSMPPKRGIQLTHKSNEDFCKALVTKDLQFNVKELLPEGSDEIFLILEGWDKPLKLTP